MPARNAFVTAAFALLTILTVAFSQSLQVLTTSSLEHALGDNSLRKVIYKRSSQKLDLKQLDTVRPLRRTKRRWVITTLELEEEDKGPFPKPIGELFNDVAQDVTVKYIISGPGVDEFPEFGLFSIEDDAEGHVYVHRTIDRETTPSFTIRFDVADRNTGEIVDRSLLFNVAIKDVNDNAPEFPQKEFNITMKENHKRDELVFNITAFDKDEEGTENSQVTYSLVSQTPHSKQSLFTVDSSTGLIRSTGCLDYETTKAFQLLIKATDHGNPQLSSTATINIAVEDGNNHLPTFIQEKYQLDFPEGKAEHDILRLSVEDKDAPSTPAGRAKYKIVSGNERGNFIIETDPNSNEGVLSIVKPLIHDGTSERKLVISVENEEPPFLCERGLVRNVPSPIYSKASVDINVIDRNDAPQFNPSILVLRQEEGVKSGTRIGQYMAKDPDATPNVIRYRIASDPDGWVTIDENSGVVMTAKTLDRESPHLNNSIYTIKIHAIDDGLPPQTGTGTIQLYLSDLNDNAPMLVTPSLVVCEGKEKDPLHIKAEDKDSHPYAGPFTFQLVETVDNMGNSWKLGESFDDSVELFMIKSLPSGNYSVPFHISDKQGFFKEQTLHVTVCACQDGKTCEQMSERASVSVGLGGGAVGAILAAFLLLILAMGLLLWCPRTEKGQPFIPHEGGNQSLIQYNEESQQVLSQDTPDAGILATSLPEYAQISKEKSQTAKEATGVTPSHSQTSSQVHYEQSLFDAPGTFQAKTTEKSGRIVPPLTIQEDFQPSPAWVQQATRFPQSNTIHWEKPSDRILEAVGRILNQKMDYICNLEDNIGSYSPRVYAQEGQLEKPESVWSLPVAHDFDDNSLPPDFFDSLGPRFATLGRICSK
ncbi:cadherin-like protein 26 [Sceloporus undulatus]|uniref:cadherin-like protein 26 n=1 Tax=Sceloporus undulatus TaxID=8520 RepID=UPI001C4BE6C2|nr:cadherin-like protein 26 [Sceloporus undulatus]